MQNEIQSLNAEVFANGTTAVKLAAIVASSTDAIIGKDVDGIIESWNPGAESLYGYTSEETIGKSISLLFPKGAEDEFPILMDKIRAGERIESYETTRVKKNGNLIEVSLTISPIRDSQGIVTGASTIARDVTLIRQVDEAKQKLNTMESMALLAGGVAHDLNNLMATVMGNAELLGIEFRSRMGAMESVHAILTASQQAGELAQALLAFAQGGRHESVELNMNNVIQQVLRMKLKPVQQGIKFKLKFDPHLMPVNADPTQMDQMIHNLLLNAIEAIEGEGEIVVTTSNVEKATLLSETHPGILPDWCVVVDISDSGCGMTPEVNSNAFKPFFSTKGLGRGLGLAAVYGIVKNHGGDVTAKNQSVSGVLLTVTLPASVMKTCDIPPNLVGGSRGSETILVVDDEAQILMINRHILEASGYHVLTARDGAEALRVAHEFDGDIHLVVLDMAMPVMDGAQAFVKLKESRPTCKIIVSSGFDLNEKARSLMVAGADSFLQKPFRLTDLTAEVRRLLDHQKENKE